MTPENNIAQELKELESSLAGLSAQNTYSVPEGYFEGLAERVLSRIRAMEAATAAEELRYLSPLLSQLPKTMPYQVPAGYFEDMESTLVSVAMYGEQNASEELGNLSPLLSGLKKEMPYSVPAGYFDTISAPVAAENKPAKVVSMGGSRKWFRYAAAAVVTGVVALTAIQFYNRPASIDPNMDSHAWVKKNTEKIKSEKIEELIQLTRIEETNGQESIAAAEPKIKEVKELIKDIPDTEIQELLKDTELLDENLTDDASDISMKP